MQHAGSAVSAMLKGGVEGVVIEGLGSGEHYSAEYIGCLA